jgi:outer membrane protein TolC
MRIPVLAILVVALSRSALAAEAPQPLLPDQVLRSAAKHFPTVMKATAERDAREGERLSALGAFDTQIESSGFDRLAGFYDGRSISGGVSRQFRDFGSKVYSAYSVSNGTLPVYEDEYYTNESGKLKLGVLFSLLRDRSIDELRFAERDTQLAVQEADIELLLTRIEVQQRALMAYWDWVRKGHALSAYRDLLDIALQRQQALETEVNQGRRARIFLVENQMNITRRQSLVTSTERDFDIAATRLAMFWRDGNGAPQAPEADALPALELLQRNPEAPTEAEIDAMLQRRPELRLLRTTMERTERSLLLAENDMQPRLDFNVEMAQPFGTIGEGGVSRDDPEAIVGFTFSVPLENRRAKGKVASSRAKLRALEAEQQRTVETLRIELNALLAALQAARELEQLALLEVEQTTELRLAEIRRFENGASDFFLVNVREQAAANAEIKLVNARADLAVAQARYDGAMLNLERLQLADNS